MPVWRLTSPRICQQQAGDPEEQMCISSPNVGRLETQEEPMFHFESEGRKKNTVTIQRQSGRRSYFFFTGGSAILFYAGLQLIG